MNKLDHLIKSIDRLVELNEEILCEIRGDRGNEPAVDPTQWMEALEVLKMLKISRSTLYRRTKDETVKPRFFGSRKYYSLADIFKLKERYTK